MDYLVLCIRRKLFQHFYSSTVVPFIVICSFALKKDEDDLVSESYNP